MVVASEAHSGGIGIDDSGEAVFEYAPLINFIIAVASVWPTVLDRERSGYHLFVGRR
jgi:hypothetical protein